MPTLDVTFNPDLGAPEGMILLSKLVVRALYRPLGTIWGRTIVKTLPSAFCDARGNRNPSQVHYYVPLPNIQPEFDNQSAPKPLEVRRLNIYGPNELNVSASFAYDKEKDILYVFAVTVNWPVDLYRLKNAVSAPKTYTTKEPREP